jgi:phosphate transport system permease protein
MTLGLALLGVLLVAAIAAVIAFRRASALRVARAKGARLNSLPIYHAFYAILWATLPALLLLAAWSPVQTRLVQQSVLSSPQGKALPDSDIQRDSILGEAQDIASGKIEAGFNPQSTTLAPMFRAASSKYASIGGAFALLAAIAGVKFEFRARSGVERWVMLLLMAASTVAILTTLGIVLSLLFESIRFFKMVPITDFLFGTSWSPQMALRADQAGSSGEFGSIPLFWGTAFIGAIIAMIVAIPLGLMSAIFLTQYAAPSVRAWLKPILEILAGVPTVVYGYFAALTVAPMVRDFGVSIGVTSASSESALAAGLVMGIMIIPFVSSMADDSIAAVPLGRHQVRDDQEGRPSRRAPRGRRRSPPGGQPRDRRDDDRRHGCRPFRQHDRQSVPRGHHRHRPDRPIADRRPGIRQRENARRLCARACAVHHHADSQPHRADRRAPLSGSL